MDVVSDACREGCEAIEKHERQLVGVGVGGHTVSHGRMHQAVKAVVAGLEMLPSWTISWGRQEGDRVRISEADWTASWKSLVVGVVV